MAEDLLNALMLSEPFKLVFDVSSRLHVGGRS